MKTIIQVKKGSIAAPLMLKTFNRLRFAFRLTRQSVKKISVQIINADISQRSKARCKVTIDTVEHGLIVFEEQSARALVAIERAITRSSRYLDKRIRRERALEQAALSVP